MWSDVIILFQPDIDYSFRLANAVEPFCINDFFSRTCSD